VDNRIYNIRRDFGSLSRLLALAGVGVGITLGAGIVSGRLLHRWGPTPDLQAAASNLENMPLQIGDWQLQSEEQIPKIMLDVLMCAGHVNRTYVNRQSGKTVNVAIIVGPAGPTSVHTPEICYSSRARTVNGPRVREILTDPTGEPNSFWKLSFNSNSLPTDQLRVYYAWTTDGKWNAAESPRFEFVGQPLLFKIQVASQVSTLDTDATLDPCQQFLTEFLKSGWKTSG
jgi:Protein of unknown function (DUF3485)